MSSPAVGIHRACSVVTSFIGELIQTSLNRFIIVEGMKQQGKIQLETN